LKGASLPVAACTRIARRDAQRIAAVNISRNPSKKIRYLASNLNLPQMIIKDERGDDDLSAKIYEYSNIETHDRHVPLCAQVLVDLRSSTEPLT